METISARKFLKITKHFPEYMLSPSMINIRSDATLVVCQQNKAILAAVCAILLAVILPIFDLNTSQTIFRQVISPLAAFVISIWVFFQMIFPVRAIARFDLMEKSELITLEKFNSLEYKPHSLSDKEGVIYFCAQALEILSQKVKDRASLVTKLRSEIETLPDGPSKEALGFNLQAAEYDLREALLLFDDHFCCWSRIPSLVTKYRGDFFPDGIPVKAKT